MGCSKQFFGIMGKKTFGIQQTVFEKMVNFWGDGVYLKYGKYVGYSKRFWNYGKKIWDTANGFLGRW